MKESNNMAVEEFKQLALSIPGTIQSPHFDRVAFKVENKRIFATLHEPSGTANLKLSEIDQSVFCSFNKDAIYPVPNKWGLQGWTTFVLTLIPKEMMYDALNTACLAAFNTKRRSKK